GEQRDGSQQAGTNQTTHAASQNLCCRTELLLAWMSGWRPGQPGSCRIERSKSLNFHQRRLAGSLQQAAGVLGRVSLAENAVPGHQHLDPGADGVGYGSQPNAAVNLNAETQP